MGAYVCPSCNGQLIYTENDLSSVKNHKGVTGHCENREVCGVESIHIIINKEAEDKA